MLYTLYVRYPSRNKNNAAGQRVKAAISGVEVARVGNEKVGLTSRRRHNIIILYTCRNVLYPETVLLIQHVTSHGRAHGPNSYAIVFQLKIVSVFC